MKKLLLTISLLVSIIAFSQGVGIGTTNPNTSSLLDLESTTKGFLPPRMTTAQRNAIATPATGLMVYNTTLACLQVNDGTPAIPNWTCLAGAPALPTVVSNCTINGFTGNYFAGIATSGTTFTVTVTNNSFSSVTIAFQNSDLALGDLAGLAVTATSPASATLNAGQSQLVTYTITGTPAASGTLTGTWTKLALNCTRIQAVTLPPPTFNCAGMVVSPNSYNLINGQSYTGTITVPYTAPAAGGTYAEQIITNQGITFTRAAGTYATSGTITYTIGGTYTGPSDAVFFVTLDANAGSCSVHVWDAIRDALAIGGCASCAAYDAANVNDVVRVTADEFNQLGTTIPGMVNFGRKAADDSRTIGSAAYTNNMVNNNITVGSYPFAFSTLLSTNPSGVKLVTQSSTTTGGNSSNNFNSGACHLFTPLSNGLYYFVMKRPNVPMPANTNIAVKGYYNGWGTGSGGNGCDGCTGSTISGTSGDNSQTCTQISATLTALPGAGAFPGSWYLNYNIKWTNTKMW
jgi:hypothetical protein